MLGAGGAVAQALDTTRAPVQRFIDDMVQQQDMDRAVVAGWLADAVPQQSIIDLISKPAERTLAWWEYRARFLTEARIKAGLALWDSEQAALAQAAREYGVPPQYLLAIAGVETSFGRITGRYRVLDALATLAFDYPPRSDYFTRELAQYLLLAREESLDPRRPLGSYAGAMGAAQFMPTSLRNFAVDGDGDGRRDLWNNWTDVFASIANYLVQHGWKTGEPVLATAQPPSPADDPASLRLELADTVAGLRARGYTFDTALAGDSPALVVAAQQQDRLAWRVGFANFYAITRYNRSTLYAMAVHELAQALATRHDAAGAR